MKRWKQHISGLLALVMVLAMFAAVPPQAKAADVDIRLKVGESHTIALSEGTDHKWSVGNASILGCETSGSSCIITGKKAGKTTVTVTYNYRVAGWSGVVGEYGFLTTGWDTLPSYQTWNVLVEEGDASSGSASSTAPASSTAAPAVFVEPAVKRGIVGEDVSKYITRISGYNKNVGLVAVEAGGLWGFADKDLKLVIPFQFSSVMTSGNYGKYVKVYVGEDKKNAFLMDGSGNYLMREGYPAYTFYGDYFSANGSDSLGRPANFRYFKIEGDEVKKITKADFEAGIKDYKAPDEGKLYIQIRDGKNWCFAHAGKPVGTGEDWVLVLTPPEGVVCPTGSKLNPFLCEGVMVVTKDGKLGAIDTAGQVVIPFQYDELNNSSGGYMTYKMGETFGILENPVNPPVKEEPQPAEAADTGSLKAGDTVSTLIESRSKTSGCGLTAVKIGGLYGYVDEKDTLVIPCKFSRASDFKEYGDGSKLASVEFPDGKANIINNKGELILSRNYNAASLTVTVGSIYATDISETGKRTTYYFDYNGNLISQSPLS